MDRDTKTPYRKAPASWNPELFAVRAIELTYRMQNNPIQKVESQKYDSFFWMLKGHNAFFKS